MTITRDNYEPYFLDFLEGNLPEDQFDQFLDFLEQNPDLKAELHGFENLRLDEEAILFSGKERLYKTSDEAKVAMETKMIALMEGDLVEDERTSFEVYLSAHPELQKEQQLFSKTRLVADPSFHFQAKQKLYKKSRPVVVLNWVARVAAVVALMWGINALYNGQSGQISQDSQKKTAEVIPAKPAPLVKTIDTEKIQAEPTIQEKNKITKATITSKPKNISQKAEESLEENKPESQIPIEGDITVLAMIQSLSARLETEALPNQLAVSRIPEMGQSAGPNILTVDQFLALQAKKVEEKGILSARRLVLSGLGLASELSGERIGYREKNGKITSLDFESRLIAFSIPLKKE